jgi:hypothetical protein
MAGPPLIEVEPERSFLVPPVRIVDEEPDADDHRAIGERHLVAVCLRPDDGSTGRLPLRTDGHEKLIRQRGVLAPAHSLRDDLPRGRLHGEDRPHDSGAVIPDHPFSHERQARQSTSLEDASPRTDRRAGFEIRSLG